MKYLITWELQLPGEKDAAQQVSQKGQQPIMGTSKGAQEGNQGSNPMLAMNLQGQRNRTFKLSESNNYL